MGVEANTSQERKDYAAKLKAAGNKAYGSKDYNRAIELYGKAILCKQDPVFYSNRAACYNAMSDWDKVIEDTTAAINLDNEYVKALNRRANAYEQVELNSEALLDYTASCIIDGFRNESSAQSVERLLKKVAEQKGKAILASKEKKLPSPTFVTNYLQSFRPKPAPAGLDDEAELDEESGKGQLRKGLKAMGTKTAEGYAEAASAFDRALELGDLGEHEAFAYNMRGTFRYLKGDNEDALQDMDKSVELQPSLTQSFIKRASMHLELGTYLNETSQRQTLTLNSQPRGRRSRLRNRHRTEREGPRHHLPPRAAPLHQVRVRRGRKGLPALHRPGRDLHLLAHPARCHAVQDGLHRLLHGHLPPLHEELLPSPRRLQLLR